MGGGGRKGRKEWEEEEGRRGEGGRRMQKNSAHKLPYQPVRYNDNQLVQ